jgi:predicted phosphodiesterase
MKLAIISDIHANIEALKAVLQEIARIRVDEVVCLGDIVGYNVNPAECIALLRERGVLCIAGNHDRAVTGQITTQGFSYTAARAVAWTRERLAPEHLAFLADLPLKMHVREALVCVHGALHVATGCETIRLDTDERRRASLEALRADPSHARICAFGHTHRPGLFGLCGDVMQSAAGDRLALRPDTVYLVNPGSVGQPRVADKRATFAVYDARSSHITVHRIAYDFDVPFEKTRRAGLLRPLSFLPAPLRKPLAGAARALGMIG